MTEPPDAGSIVQRIEELLQEIGDADPGARADAAELVRLLMQLYGAGLHRIMDVLGETRSQAAIDLLVEDKLAASLLLLHGLHPVAPADRIRPALARLERAAPHRLVLQEIADGVARVRVERNGGPAPAGLGRAIEQAIAAAAPDLRGVVVEGLAAESSLVQIEVAQGR